MGGVLTVEILQGVGVIAGVIVVLLLFLWLVDLFMYQLMVLAIAGLGIGLVCAVGYLVSGHPQPPMWDSALMLSSLVFAIAIIGGDMLLNG